MRASLLEGPKALSSASASTQPLRPPSSGRTFRDGQALQANAETDRHVLGSLRSYPPVLEASGKGKRRRGRVYRIL